MTAATKEKSKPTTETRRHGENQERVHRGDAEARRNANQVNNANQRVDLVFRDLRTKRCFEIVLFLANCCTAFGPQDSPCGLCDPVVKFNFAFLRVPFVASVVALVLFLVAAWLRCVFGVYSAPPRLRGAL